MRAAIRELHRVGEEQGDSVRARDQIRAIPVPRAERPGGGAARARRGRDPRPAQLAPALAATRPSRTHTRHPVRAARR